MEQANPGDIVALASGGPDLTVMYVTSHGGELAAALSWFTAVGEYRTGELPLKVLVLRRASGRREPAWYVLDAKPTPSTAPQRLAHDAPAAKERPVERAPRRPSSRRR